METNFRISVATKDIDKELREYLCTKLSYIATKEAKKLVDEKFHELVSGKISNHFDELVKGKSRAFNNQVEKVVTEAIKNQTPSYSEIRKLVKEEIDERLSGINIQLLIKNILKEEIEKMALDTIKEKVIEALK